MTKTKYRYLIFVIKLLYNIIYKIYLIFIQNKSSNFHNKLKSKIFLKNHFFVNIHKKMIIENFSLKLSFVNIIFFVNNFRFYLKNLIFYFLKIKIKSKNSKFNSNLKPFISIIIPTYDQTFKLYRCLESILINNFKFKYEIIVIDDLETRKNKPWFINKNIKYIKNKNNLGFLKSCNHASKFANGKYIYFFNDDARLADEKSLQSLIDVFEQNKKVGLVGSKILINHRTLQEAGCITFKDGNCYQFGKFNNHREDVYNYLTEVDYVSGCSLMIPKKLFLKNNFNIMYKPAYYEDVDLAFQLKQKGYKIYYQPLSKVFHEEGSSSNSGESSTKKYQEVNRIKFKEKWKDKLSNNHKIDPIISRFIKPIVVIIDDLIPDASRDAGSFLPLFFIEYLKKKNYQILFFAKNINPNSEKVQKLQSEGIFVVYTYSNLTNYLTILKNKISSIIIFRAPLLKQYSKILFKLKKKIYFHYVDLHFLRLSREISNNKIGYIFKNEIKELKNIETKLVKKNYLNISCSYDEVNMLKADFKIMNVAHIPLFYPYLKKTRSQNKNKKIKIVFIGSFNHTPNTDAVNFLCKEIYPKIKNKISIYIIGSFEEKIQHLKNDNIHILGKVENLDVILKKMDLAISPLRYGAGTKGKLLTYATYNLPVICSKISVEGTLFRHKKHCYIPESEEPEIYAKEIIKLYENKKLSSEISRNLNSLFLEKYSFQNGFKLLDKNKKIKF